MWQVEGSFQLFSHHLHVTDGVSQKGSAGGAILKPRLPSGVLRVILRGLATWSSVWMIS